MRKSLADLHGKSTRKSLYKSPSAKSKSAGHIHRALTSPPLQKFKSRMSKSKRLPNESHPNSTCKDLGFLALYYVALYVFFAVFWFAAWAIYSTTLPKDKARYSLSTVDNNKTDAGSSRSAILCNYNST